VLRSCAQHDVADIEARRAAAHLTDPEPGTPPAPASEKAE